MGGGVSSRTAASDRGIGRRGFVSSLVVATAGVALAGGAGGAGAKRLPPQIMWTAADFEPFVGTWFEVVDPAVTDGRLRLETVTQVGRPGAGGPSGRAPFSLLFAGDTDGLCDQATCRLRHRTAGDMTLLLVPVGGSGAISRFEAVVG